MNPFWPVISLVFLALLVFLPRYGLRVRLARWREQQRREQVEDALKYLLDREQEGSHPTPEALSGALGLSRAATFRLLTRMEGQGLIETRGHAIHLTAEGERWALHIVRAHRLWERYLADEARMPLGKVHSEAHRREHHLTPDELDELEAALGHPSHDPHGDPIPARDGTLPHAEGTPLTAWPTDRPARIVHLEDEPPLAYQQILAVGLRLGQTVRLLEKTPQRYTLSDGEREYLLAPAVAANVHVAPVADEEHPPTDAIPLSELPHGREAEVVTVDRAVQGFTRRRFLDLGLTPGARVTPELANFFGDPRAYRVRGTLIALRNEQAARIWVRPATTDDHR